MSDVESGRVLFALWPDSLFVHPVALVRLRRVSSSGLLTPEKLAVTINW
jgi:hypothetical protein